MCKRQGEDLWTISEKFYGTGYNWSDIVEANELVNPDRVEAGVEITIPDVEPVPAPEKVEYEEYTVKSGETLFDIAVKVYGGIDCSFPWSQTSFSSIFDRSAASAALR